jgi:hypothetical protein
MMTTTILKRKTTMTSNDQIREQLAEALADQMIEAVPDLPERWGNHVRKQMVEAMLKTNEGFDLAAASTVAIDELDTLSGLGGVPTYGKEVLAALFGIYSDDPAEVMTGSADGDAATLSTREQFLDAIAGDMIQTALEGIPLPAGTAEDLRPAMVEALKGGTSDQVDDAGARNVIRQHVLALSLKGLELDREAFEQRLTAA